VGASLMPVQADHYLTYSESEPGCACRHSVKSVARHKAGDQVRAGVPRVGRETSGSEACHGTIDNQVPRGRVAATGARLCSRVRPRASSERVGRLGGTRPASNWRACALERRDRLAPRTRDRTAPRPIMAQGRRRSGAWARRRSVAVRSSEVIGPRVGRETADERTDGSDADHGTGSALFWRVAATGAEAEWSKMWGNQLTGSGLGPLISLMYCAIRVFKVVH
jgi:hypothetical protein